MSDAAPPTTKRPVRKIEVFAWTMFDWANSAYSVFQITILQQFLNLFVLPGDDGILAYGWAIGISTLTAGVISPVLGAIADAHASKRFWLTVTALTGAGAAVAIYFVPLERSWVIVALFFLTSLGYELAWGIYNAFLPEIADETSMNRISSYGFALGYIGGGLALILGLIVIMFGGRLGLPEPAAGERDFVQGSRIIFAVELPPGDYGAQVTLGDLEHAHDRMQVAINGQDVETITTAKGEFVTRAFPAGVSAGRLTLSVQGAAQAGAKSSALHEQAVLNDLSIRGGALKQPLTFDFGTSGSAATDGALWATADDTFRSRDREVLAEHAKNIPAEDLPAELTYGFTNESSPLVSRDSVIIPRIQLSILIMGLWWGVFSLPTILILRDRVLPRAKRESLLQTTVTAFREVKRTITSIRTYRMLFLFLIAFLVYNDGVVTIISQAPVFAERALHIKPSELIMVVLMIQFVSMPGALFVGWLAGKVGEKRTLLGCIAVYIGWLLAAFFINTMWQFWLMGVVLALIMGGIQSVSRAIMGLMTPASRSGEFFGFFNLSSKATSFVGPPLFVSILAWTGRPHLAILSMLVFFVVGGGLACFVNVAEGHRRAQEVS